MPKLYGYLGIIIYFWSNEHDPVHVHGGCQGRESKAELHIEDGLVKEIKIMNSKAAALLTLLSYEILSALFSRNQMRLFRNG